MLIKTLTTLGLALAPAFMMSTTALAADADGIPVTVDLSNVQALPGTLYISIQTKAQYMGINRAGGGTIATVSPGMVEATYEVAQAPAPTPSASGTTSMTTASFP